MIEFCAFLDSRLEMIQVCALEDSCFSIIEKFQDNFLLGFPRISHNSTTWTIFMSNPLILQLFPYRNLLFNSVDDYYRFLFNLYISHEFSLHHTTPLWSSLWSLNDVAIRLVFAFFSLLFLLAFSLGKIVLCRVFSEASKIVSFFFRL